MNHLSASTFLPYYLRHANMASISQSRKVTHTKASRTCCHLSPTHSGIWGIATPRIIFGSAGHKPCEPAGSAPVASFFCPAVWVYSGSWPAYVIWVCSDHWVYHSLGVDSTLHYSLWLSWWLKLESDPSEGFTPWTSWSWTCQWILAWTHLFSICPSHLYHGSTHKAQTPPPFTSWLPNLNGSSPPVETFRSHLTQPVNLSSKTHPLILGASIHVCYSQTQQEFYLAKVWKLLGEVVGMLQHLWVYCTLGGFSHCMN